MNIPGLKLLFLQSEIERSKRLLDQYESIFAECEIKDISLRRLIATKEREIEILEELLKGQRNE